MFLSFNAPHTPIQPPDKWPRSKVIDREKDTGIDHEARET